MWFFLSLFLPLEYALLVEKLDQKWLERLDLSASAMHYARAERKWRNVGNLIVALIVI